MGVFLVTVYFDPTEAMEGTHIPSHFFDFALPLKGLEKLTGADFLITPLDEPCPPIPAAIRKHCEVGDLVQRKSGNDMLQSLDKLGRIIERMLQWTDHPWLLESGISIGRGGNLKIDGRGVSGLWNRVSGAEDAWHDKGGYVKRLPYDVLITGWVQLREKRLRHLLHNPEKHVSRPHRQSVSYEKENWVWSLGAFPKGVGVKTTQAIARYLSEHDMPLTLSGVYQLICTGEMLKVPGVGKTTLRKMRDPKWWGIPEDIEARIGQVIKVGKQRYIIEEHPLNIRYADGSDGGVNPIPQGTVVPRKV